MAVIVAPEVRETVLLPEIIGGINDMYAALMRGDRIGFDVHLSAGVTAWESHFPHLYSRAELDAFRDQRHDDDGDPQVGSFTVTVMRAEVLGPDAAFVAYELGIDPGVQAAAVPGAGMADSDADSTAADSGAVGSTMAVVDETAAGIRDTARQPLAVPSPQSAIPHVASGGTADPGTTDSYASAPGIADLSAATMGTIAGGAVQRTAVPGLNSAAPHVASIGTGVEVASLERFWVTEVYRNEPEHGWRIVHHHAQKVQ